MKYTNNKKGFTLVELLVVIAILAILATVSIVGYSSFTKNAKMSNDTTLVTEWNRLLQADDYIEDINNVIEAKNLFTENNYSDDFIPESSGYHFYWSHDNNMVYLVLDKNDNQFDIAYPNDEKKVITKENSYRLDKEYCLLTENHDDYSFDKTVLVVGEDNEITITTAEGKQTPNKVKVGSTSYTVSSNKIKIKPSNTTTLSVTEFVLKQEQTCPIPTAESSNIKATSVTLTAISSGQGDTKYGYSTTNDSNTVSNWKSEVSFTDLSALTTYYFFAKYLGNDDYSEAISSSLQITTTELTYLVTFDKQGGTGGSDSVNAINGQAMPSMTAPSKTGYTFKGYYSATNGGGTKYYTENGASEKNYDLTTDTTLYAYWTVNSYSISYYDSGSTTFSGTHETSYPVTHKYDTATTLDSPTKDGYTFEGYYTDSDCTSTNKVTSLSATGYTSDISLYAKWKENYKPLRVEITTGNGTQQTVNYYPVLGGTNPQPTSFAYSTDGKTFTEIAKTGSGNTEYQMSDVATYAKNGNLYYTGTVFCVRSVNGISWSDTFKTPSSGNLASTTDLQDGIKGKINTSLENVEGIGEEYEAYIDGVSLNSIYNAYKDDTIVGFGSTDGHLWTNVVNGVEAWCYRCAKELEDMDKGIYCCVLISRTFN